MRSVLIYCGCLILVTFYGVEDHSYKKSFAQETPPATTSPSTSTSSTSTRSPSSSPPSEGSNDTARGENVQANVDTSSANSGIETREPSSENSLSGEEGGETPAVDASLIQLYTQLLESQTSQLIPDVRNGLIRVGTLLIEADSSVQNEIDLPVAQALTRQLIHVIRQQNNLIHISFNENREILTHFRKTTSLFFDQETRVRGRLISLGRLLGVRYLFVTQVTRNEGKLEFTLKVLSIKSKSWIGQGSSRYLDDKALTKFKKESLFRESKWGGVWRSALLPGWGQFYQKRPHQGVLYSLSTLGLLAGGLLSYTQGVDYQKQYEEEKASNVPYRLRANDAFQRANFFWGALGTVWAMSILDGYLNGQDRIHFRFSFNPQGGVALSGDF